MRLARFTYAVGTSCPKQHGATLSQTRRKTSRSRPGTVQRSVSRGTRASRKNTEEVTAASAGTGHPC
ncbi:hypothetical protein WN51_02348 [Melipona quadrifasciata]|uniref:Uncharacterized protein n=1 Tax=Melipona quadrifasciata TaxID=166423 RepID=A0A0N0U4B6_9HYME|nr:hypothetical protein WN51_02348 [Melipona quadrifasciata]